MGQYRNEEARVIFAELATQDPQWWDARVNEAIATLNRQREGDERRALAMVDTVLEQQPDHARARYVSGLMNFYLGRSEQALEAFQRVLEQYPGDPHVAYFAGQALSQMGSFDEAVDLYLRAIEADPYLRSAYYGAALTLRRLGDNQQAREKMGVYQRFENNPRAHLAEFRYTRMGPLAEAKAVGEWSEGASTALPDGPLFASAQRLLSLDSAAPQLGLTTVDLNADGRQDVFIAGGPQQASQVLLNDEQGWQLASEHALAGLTGVTAAAWGDVDNDGHLDGFFCGPGGQRLFSYRNGAWTQADGAEDLAFAAVCSDAMLIDADHDGELDILGAYADAPAELFNNNFNGSYQRLSLSEQGQFPLTEPGARQLLAGDFDADRDADLLILNADGEHQVLRNNRLWQYETFPGTEAIQAAPLVAASAADLNADGQLALIGLTGSGVLQAWTPASDGIWQARELASIAVPKPETAGLAVADFRGDGRPEILVHHSEGFVVLNAQGETLYQEAIPLAGMLPILLDPARGPSLLAVRSDEQGSELLLWSPGAGRHEFLALQATGKTDRADGMRSNASGIGTGVVMRVGRQWILADTYDRHSAAGQSLQPLAIGLAGSDRAAFVQLFWTDGVMQTEMDLVAGKQHRIAEQQRQLASCPVLFAWNGERFEFVSDLLGVAGIGFFLQPGQYAEPRPWEFFKFPHGTLVPRDGRYAIKIAEPMEEIAYIDTARLHVYDLPDDWAVTLDERMFTGGGPQPTGDAVFYRQSGLLRPRQVVNHRGEDVTSSVLATDFEAAPPGEKDPRFLGRLAEDHVLTLDFGEVINPLGSEPVLLASGWVEYPYSQTLFAAWQAEADYRPASLEALADGVWQPVYERFGYPAGMPREMSLPLHALPANTTALRIRGNWEIYWDEIAVVHAEPAPAQAMISRLTIDQARLAKTGFARRDTLDQRLPYYDYQDRSPFWDTKYQSGLYTALGPVEALVEEQNEAFAIFGPGDELHLEFEAPAEAPPGTRRTVVLEVHGYAKDMDLYTRNGETVGPLPGVASERRDALHERFNTRYQGGR
jgi:Tfp pilus assembly protein PilF